MATHSEIPGRPGADGDRVSPSYEPRFINALTDRVIGCAYTVHNTLGAGFLEKVYENALGVELQLAGLTVVQQHALPVRYRGHLVGEYFADLLVEGRLVIEVKAVVNLAKEHEVQIVHYLTATGIDDGLLINFGPRVDVKRKFRVYKRQDSQDKQDGNGGDQQQLLTLVKEVNTPLNEIPFNETPAVADMADVTDEPDP